MSNQPPATDRMVYDLPFGQRCALARADRQLTLKSAAAFADITPSRLQSIETGRVQPSRAEIVYLCLLYNLPVRRYIEYACPTHHGSEVRND